MAKNEDDGVGCDAERECNKEIMDRAGKVPFAHEHVVLLAPGAVRGASSLPLTHPLPPPPPLPHHPFRAFISHPRIHPLAHAPDTYGLQTTSGRTASSLALAHRKLSNVQGDSQ